MMPATTKGAKGPVAISANAKAILAAVAIAAIPALSHKI